MARDLEVTPDPSESVVSRNGSVRSLRCTPSELIVHYFLDALSPVEKKDLADHLSACDLCSAKLLALEISAAVGAETVTALRPGSRRLGARCRYAPSGTAGHGHA